MIEIQRAESENSTCDIYNLSVDGHLILSRYYGDLNWILTVENAVKSLFPHLINLPALEIQKHDHFIILKAFLNHQEYHFKRFTHGAIKKVFDYDYNPSHYFNYEIPS